MSDAQSSSGHDINNSSLTKSAVNDNSAGIGPFDKMPTSFVGRWLLYLADIDAGAVPSQRLFEGYCYDCQEQDDEANEEASYLSASNTEEVRQYLSVHNDHNIRLYLRYDGEIADLDIKSKTALLGVALYRREWVAVIPDHELLQYGGIGPTLLASANQKQIVGVRSR